MSKILPNLTALAIIAASVGLNIWRYPIVDRSLRSMKEFGRTDASAPETPLPTSSEDQATSNAIKTESDASIASAGDEKASTHDQKPTEEAALNSSEAVPVSATTVSSPETKPIALPVPEKSADGLKTSPDATGRLPDEFASANYTESPPAQSEQEGVQQAGPMVPVFMPKFLTPTAASSSSNASAAINGVERLPPISETVIAPSSVYAADYSGDLQSIPFYPSTGK